MLCWFAEVKRSTAQVPAAPDPTTPEQDRKPSAQSDTMPNTDDSLDNDGSTVMYAGLAALEAANPGLKVNVWRCQNKWCSYVRLPGQLAQQNYKITDPMAVLYGHMLAYVVCRVSQGKAKGPLRYAQRAPRYVFLLVDG